MRIPPSQALALAEEALTLAVQIIQEGES